MGIVVMDMGGAGPRPLVEYSSIVVGFLYSGPLDMVFYVSLLCCVF